MSKALLCLVGILLAGVSGSAAQSITLVELNCENLFDCRHDTLKHDEEFLPDGPRRWTYTRYRRKLNNIAQELLSCSDRLPDLVALVEVENDTVMHDLTRHSLLRNAGYHYLMTESPDARGIDVALLYQPASFRPVCYECMEVPLVGDMNPTRDILYVKGETVGGDTLHLFVIHAPSRYGGEMQTRNIRKHVAQTLCSFISDIVGNASKRCNSEKIIIAGDFNDYADSPSLRQYYSLGLANVSRSARGTNGAKGTYRYRGEWRSIDHVLVSPALEKKIGTVSINDANFLLEDEPRYGGRKPKRTFVGYKYQPGFSDHLPLVVTINL